LNEYVNMILGDIANIFVTVNSIVYACVIVFSNLSYSSILYSDNNIHGNKFISSNVLIDGFCISNKESLWLSSHALCFYLDTFFCIMLYRCKIDGVKHYLPSRIMRPINSNILAHFGHGVGHFLIGYELTTIDFTTQSTIEYQNILWLTLFWYGFIQAIHTTLSLNEHVLVSIIISFVQLFIPTQFGFTYVQTILLLLSTINDLSIKKEEKDDFYTLKACFVNVPIGIVGWIEAYTCNSFLIYVGGHIWYDCTIPISIMLYYFMAKTLYISSEKQ
jgi:hypothetical protein